MNKVRGGLAVVLMLSGSWLAWRSINLDAPRPRSAPQEENKVSVVPHESPPAAATNRDGSVRAPTYVKRSPGPLLQSHALAADDYPQGWDELGSAERLQHLEGRFTNALAAIEAGERPLAKHTFVAESALTSMRAELYSTASGREKHRSHESRLADVLGEAKEAASNSKGAPR